MSVNADVTLIAVLENKQLFFDLIDYADQTGPKGSDEFSIPHFNKLLSHTLDRYSGVHKTRLGDTLNIDNLDRNGLLAYSDERSDRFSLQPFVISMLRHLDSTRLRELSDAELNNLHTRLITVHKLVISEEFLWLRDDIKYQENIGLVLDTLRATTSRIHQNIQSLEGQSKRLAKLVEDNDGKNLTRSVHIREVLAKIFDITERYINPTLSFLNPDQDWKGADSTSPMQKIKQILQRFENRGFQDEYGVISRLYWQLLSSSEKIGAIRKSLDVYIRLYEDQRRLYESVETRYNELLGKVSALLDGRRKGHKIPSSDPHFNVSIRLHGLKDNKSLYAPCIDWPSIKGRALLDEHLRISLDGFEGRPEITKRKSKPKQVTQQERGARQRVVILKTAIAALNIVPESDLYMQIHKHLLENVQDYALPDLIESIPLVVRQHSVVVHSKRNHIDYRDTRLEYFQRHLEVSS